MKKLFFMMLSLVILSACEDNRHGEPGTLRNDTIGDVTYILQKDRMAAERYNQLEKRAASDACKDETLRGKHERCIEVYDPVCGCDNQTYTNACQAENAGIARYTPGACNSKNQ